MHVPGRSFWSYWNFFLPSPKEERRRTTSIDPLRRRQTCCLYVYLFNATDQLTIISTNPHKILLGWCRAWWTYIDIYIYIFVRIWLWRSWSYPLVVCLTEISWVKPMMRFYSQYMLTELKRAILDSIRVLNSITTLIMLRKKKSVMVLVVWGLQVVALRMVGVFS